MIRNRYKSLRRNIKLELNKPNGADIEKILQAINVYEKQNLNTIKKYYGERDIHINNIIGGLKQTIKAHGPITSKYLTSAAKRIYGSMMTNKPIKKETKVKVVIGQITEIIFYLAITLLLILIFKK